MEEPLGKKKTLCQYCATFMIEPVLLQCSHRLCVNCYEGIKTLEKYYKLKGECKSCLNPIQLKMLMQKDYVDRNFQKILYANNREEWDLTAQGNPNADRLFKKYAKSKKRYLDKNYKIMEVVFNLNIEHQFIGAKQTEWNPKPQHLWTYTLSFDQ